MEILRSFRLVLEVEIDKDIPELSKLEFSEKILANNFVLSDAEGNTSSLLSRGGTADLLLFRTLLGIRQKSWKPSFWEVMDSFLVAYASLAASATLLQRLLACLNFTLDSEDLFWWYKRKKWFLWPIATVQAFGNHGDEWGLTLYLRWGIYASIPTWTHSQNLPAAAAEALSLKISSHGTSIKWSWRPSH